MFIGDGAKLVRDAFALAKEKSPAIVFIDELDAIGEYFWKGVGGGGGGAEMDCVYLTVSIQPWD